MGLAVDPTAILAQFIVPWPEIVDDELLVFSLFFVIVPETVSVTDELTINVDPSPVKVIFAQAASAVTVMV